MPQCHLLSNTIIAASNFLKATSNEELYLCVLHVSKFTKLHLILHSLCTLSWHKYFVEKFLNQSVESINQSSFLFSPSNNRVKWYYLACQLNGCQPCLAAIRPLTNCQPTSHAANLTAIDRSKRCATKYPTSNLEPRTLSREWHWLSHSVVAHVALNWFFD